MKPEDLERLSAESLARVSACADGSALAAVERDLLGKGGVVAGLLASIGGLEAADRRAVGEGANALKQTVLAAIAERETAFEAERLEMERGGDGFDPTLVGTREARGSLHPVTLVSRQLEDVFLSMGYRVLDGPEVELDHYNFVGLNIPSDHPARDMQDTFWCEPAPDGTDGADLLLRTHTSCVQVRALEVLEPPFRAIVPGRVFRQEATDATHEHTFHQMEGLVVGQGITVGHLIGTMRTFLREAFGREIEVRLRPGYFPFVEPGFELDAACPFCEEGADSCRVCKGSRWIELCPCGMVHPAVLEMAGIDTDVWNGFAFGLGVSRMAMLRYGIEDIRHLLGGDLRFLEQFS